MLQSARSLTQSSHKFTTETAWILGHAFRFPDQAKHDGRLREQVEGQIRSALFSLIWLTYRRDFEAFAQTDLRSDSGWGCMLRTTQMILANALRRHFIQSEWRYSPDQRSAPIYGQILRWFQDFACPRCPFSIQNMLVAGRCFAKPVGTWFGPNEACHMIEVCATDSVQLDSVRCLTARDRVMYLDRIRSKCAIACPSNKTEWCASLHLIPTRLGSGSSCLDPQYIPFLRACFALPAFCGMVGGRPSSSLFFCGLQGSRVFYLDPHTVRRAMPLEHDFCADSSDFHCDNVRSMFITDIDPSLAIGFYCRNKAEFDSLWSSLKELCGMEFSAFDVADVEPNFDDRNMDEIEEDDDGFAMI